MFEYKPAVLFTKFYKSFYRVLYIALFYKVVSNLSYESTYTLSVSGLNVDGFMSKFGKSQQTMMKECYTFLPMELI